MTTKNQPKQSKQARQAQLKNRMRNGVIALLMAVLILVGLFIFDGFHIFQSKGPADSASGVTAEQKAQADKVFRKYLVKLISSKSKFSTENYTPSSNTSSSAVITGKTAYDTEQKSVMTSLSYACTATVDSADIKLSVTVQTQNADTYVRLNSVSGQPAELAAKNAKAKGLWYKTDQPNAVIQAQLDSGVFVFGSSVVAPGSDVEKVADILIHSNAYGYELDKHIRDTYTFSIATRKGNYAAALKQAFPGLTSVDSIVSNLFTGSETELDSTLTVREDGTAINELGLRSDACPEQAKLYLGPNGVQDTHTPGLLKILSINKPAGSVTIEPIVRWKPVADYDK
jgi:hypothetical protein